MAKKKPTRKRKPAPALFQEPKAPLPRKPQPWDWLWDEVVAEFYPMGLMNRHRSLVGAFVQDLWRLKVRPKPGDVGRKRKALAEKWHKQFGDRREVSLHALHKWWPNIGGDDALEAMLPEPSVPDDKFFSMAAAHLAENGSGGA